jgi:endonuclease YncB( thermonuclease family)
MKFGLHNAASHQTGRFLSRGPGRSAILSGFLLLPSLLLLTATLGAATPANATETRNRAFTPRTVQMKVTQVRSGHEIQSGSFKVRLHGIAAPRFGTKLGSDAVLFLNTLILNRAVSCRLTGLAFRDMEVGTCRIGGRDIAELLVREGLALPCPKLGGRRYASDAKRAKDTGINHRFDLPAYCGGFRGSEM